MVPSYHLLFALFLPTFIDLTVQDDSWVKDPSMCEVCKFLVTEFKERLDETGKSKEVFRTGHGLDQEKKKKIDYKTSELRFIEALEDPHVCEKIIEYNVHAEREGSLRYAKGRSETMETLHGLKDKGVKVELGIPEEMWDSPSAEVTRMQKKCYHLVEKYEDEIRDWYFENQNEDIMDHLCRDRVLDSGDQKCLDEKYVPKKEEADKGNKKGDTDNTPSQKTKDQKKKGKTDKKKKEKTDKNKKEKTDEKKKDKTEKKKKKNTDKKKKEKNPQGQKTEVKDEL